VHVEWPWPLAPSADPAQLDLGPPEPATVADVADEPPEGGCASTPPGVGTRARMWAVFSDRVGRALADGVDFMVRPRRDGDRLRCAGGVRKLQDLLVDAHVPRACRDLLPIVVDEHDEPLWIPGVAQRADDEAVAAGMRVWLAPTAVVCGA
jgi:tRNA(Ile)-lysidine synthetase-like protein